MTLNPIPPRQHFADELRQAEAAEPVRAKLGRRRAYATQAEADEYDAGFASWPHDDGFAINTPFSTGYWDAEKQAVMAL